MVTLRNVLVLRFILTLRYFIIAATAFTVLGATSARATIFDLTYSGPGEIVNAVITATLQANGSYLATSATGTWNGKTIVLAPVNTWGGNDNLLFPANTAQNLQFNGITFSSGTSYVNVYGNTNGNTYSYYAYVNNPAAIVLGSSENLSRVAAPGPVPGSGLLSLASLLFGFVSRRCRRLSSKVRAMLAARKFNGRSAPNMEVA